MTLSKITASILRGIQLDVRPLAGKNRLKIGSLYYAADDKGSGDDTSSEYD